MRRTLLIMVGIALSFASCGKKGGHGEYTLTSATDSVAYILGMNIAQNLEQMDSLINMEAVVMGIIAQQQQKTMFDEEQAREFFLRYYTHIYPEGQRGIEEQYLADLAKSNRRYTRTRSGLTYHIAEIGDEKQTPRYNNDLVKVRYKISRLSGEPLYSSYELADTLVCGLDDFNAGVVEALKMMGKGGRLEALIPSNLSYGELGNEEMGVLPFETLRYDIELIDMEKYGANKLKNRYKH